MMRGKQTVKKALEKTYIPSAESSEQIKKFGNYEVEIRITALHSLLEGKKTAESEICGYDIEMQLYKTTKNKKRLLITIKNINNTTFYDITYHKAHSSITQDNYYKTATNYMKQLFKKIAELNDNCDCIITTKFVVTQELKNFFS